MPSPSFDLPPWLYALTSLAGAALVLSWRLRETRSPVSLVKLVAPPLGMSTGLMMFVVPQTRVPWTWALGAVVLGATLFAWPLMRSSKLALVGDQVVMQRSRAFMWLLLGLVVVRLALRAWVEQLVSTPQTGALFFLLALGAVVRWRVAMLREFLLLQKQVVRALG
jgi:membrane protein CcdC involved in cytochrome C biogenesis